LAKSSRSFRSHLGWDYWWWLKQNRAPKNGKYLVRRINIPESNVEGILQDKQGNIWIGGSGLGRYSPKSGQWIHYDVADGIQSNSFKVGAAYQDASGILYLGGIKGVTYFNPEKSNQVYRRQRFVLLISKSLTKRYKLVKKSTIE
jgi:ligand-binding sensor domain-containing protein